MQCTQKCGIEVAALIQDDTGSSSNRTPESTKKQKYQQNMAKPINSRTGRRLRKPRYVLPLAWSIVQVTFVFQPLTRRPLLPVVTRFQLRIGWLCSGWASWATTKQKRWLQTVNIKFMVHETRIDRANSTKLVVNAKSTIQHWVEQFSVVNASCWKKTQRGHSRHLLAIEGSEVQPRWQWKYNSLTSHKYSKKMHCILSPRFFWQSPFWDPCFKLHFETATETINTTFSKYTWSYFTCMITNLNFYEFLKTTFNQTF